MRRSIRLLSAVGLALAALVLLGAGDKPHANAPRYTKEGKLVLPDYREWVFLSSGLGMNYGPSAAAGNAPPMFTNVYVNPESYRAFMKTGKWPDKTLFALEIYGSQSDSQPNKRGHFQDVLHAIEFNVKDSALPEGWRFYDFGPNDKEGAAIPKTASCFGCHEKNGAVEMTFAQFYPTILRVAKEKGTLKPGVELPKSVPMR